MRLGIFGIFAALLTACASQSTQPVSSISVPDTFLCETQIAGLDTNFPGGAGHSCSASGNTFTVRITPENTPINPSPWYALRVVPKQSGIVNIVLAYEESKHRYKPKISTDGTSWSALGEADTTISAEGRRARVKLRLGQTPALIAGQEIYLPDQYADWMNALARRKSVTQTIIGKSKEARDINMLTHSAKTDNAQTVFLVGRQHPPEVTGGLAMTHFIAELFSDTAQAKSFRDRFSIIMVPMMNPDGVLNGHWRHNVGGVDLNRDWGPFTQPETQAVKSVLDEIASDGGQELVLFLDFHSTKRNVFYTQTKEDEPTAYDFTGSWLKRSRDRLPGYDFERAERHNTHLPTSKNYMFSRFSIPAITYELGDETDRGDIQRSSTVFAQEMMRLLIENEVK